MADAKKKDEGKDEEKAPEAAPAPAGKKNLFVIIGAVVLVLVLLGAAGTVVMMKSGAAKEKAEHELSADAAGHEGASDASALKQEGSSDEEELADGEEPLGAILPLDTFVVNLNGGRYLRTQIQFEFVGREAPKRFYTRLVPIRDGILSLLTKKTADDLGNEKGKEGLRVELKDLVNETLRKEEVKRVYFTQFVIQ